MSEIASLPALPEPPDTAVATADPAVEDSTVNWTDVVEETTDTAAEEQTIEGEHEVLPEPVAAGTPALDVKAEPVTPTVTPTPAETIIPPVAVAPVTPVTPAVPFDYAAWEQGHLTSLATAYTLSDEDAAALNTEPEVVLPRILAKMHLDITRNIMSGVQGLIPDLMAQTQTAATVEAQAKNEFMTVNHDLNDPAYEEAILKVGAMFRQVNPTASKAESIQKIGELTRVSLGLPPLSSAPADTKVPVNATVTPLRAAKPFTPARGGGSGGSATPVNEWAELVSQDD